MFFVTIPLFGKEGLGEIRQKLYQPHKEIHACYQISPSPSFLKRGVFYIVIPAPCSTSSLTVSVVYNVHALGLFAFLLRVQNQLIV